MPSTGSIIKRSLHLVLLATIFDGVAALANTKAEAKAIIIKSTQQLKSSTVRNFAAWIVKTNNNKSMPFVIVDKVAARVVVFYADGQVRGAAPVLLGMAIGDDSVPDIGNRKLSTIQPDERTTPAGRFVASRDHNIHGEEIVWVDYEAAISMHRVVTSNPKERRLQRLSAENPSEHRISYGCINVSTTFYETVVSPSFANSSGVVYVLPETREIGNVFTGYAEAPKENREVGDEK